MNRRFILEGKNTKQCDVVIVIRLFKVYENSGSNRSKILLFDPLPIRDKSRKTRNNPEGIPGIAAERGEKCVESF